MLAAITGIRAKNPKQKSGDAKRQGQQDDVVKVAGQTERAQFVRVADQYDQDQHTANKADQTNESIRSHPAPFRNAGTAGLASASVLSRYILLLKHYLSPIIAIATPMVSVFLLLPNCVQPF